MTRQHQGVSLADQTARSSVVVLGSLNMDLSVTVRELPKPGETILAETVSQHPGGKGANQAVAAARLGGDVYLVGRLGQDDLAARIRAALLDTGVNIDHVRATEGATGEAFVTVDAQGENVIVVASGANADLTPAAVDQEADVLRSAGIAVTQLETPLDAVVRFAQLCNEFGVDLILNAAPYRSLPSGLLRRCRYLVLNRDEARALTSIAVEDRASAVDAAVEASRQGADRVVITLGALGCVALADGHVIELDAYEVPVTDTTGAGDAFVGALAVALAGGNDFDEALRFAAAAGATACGAKGAQSPMSLEKTRRLLDEQPHVLRRQAAKNPFHSTLALDS